MTALYTIRTAGDLTVLKLVFIALPLNSACEMVVSQENATRKFQVILTPSRLLYVFSVMIPEVPISSYYSHCFITSIMNILMSPTAGVQRCAEDCLDLPIGDAVVQHVSSFVYLGSVMTPDGRSSSGSNRRIKQASAAFGDLRLVLLDNRLSLAARRRLYSACVLTVLLYGAECWTPRKSDLRSLDGFHHQCFRTILSISKERQKLDRSTSSLEMWRDPISVSERVRSRQMKWLGHLVRMPSTRIPRQLLFSSLPFPRPFCDPRLR